MTRWDEQEKQKSTGISTALLMIIGIFAMGFVVGAIWGYAFNDAEQTTPIPRAFGEISTFIGPPDYKTSFDILEQYRALTEIQHFKVTLYDGISISDTVILSSETFIKP